MGTRPLAMAVISLAAVAHALAAPQLISVGKGGEVGVNFGGYHASAGLGGLLGGGATGGLHAEAGTPHGQEARAGIGGSVDSGAKGGLYGLEEETGGGAGGAGARGGAYASAHSGVHSASASLSGETASKQDNRRLFGGESAADAAPKATSSAGSAGFSASFGAAGYAGGSGLASGASSLSAGAAGASGGGKYKEVAVNYVTAPPVVVEKHISTNYVAPAPAVHFEKHFSTSYQPVAPAVHIEKYYEVPPPAVVHVEKHVEVPPPVVYKEVHVNKHHYKRPHHHHHAWAEGHFDVGGGAGASGVEASNVKTVAVQPETRVVYKEVRPPVVEKRVDIVSEKEYVPVSADAAYSTRVKFSHRNPTFFSDIFNIPIQAISSVGKLVGNAVAGTNLSVEKTAYVHADKELGGASKSLTTDTAMQLKTPSAGTFLDDVFAIPINTLTAVNKFLENNVPVRKQVVVQSSVAGAAGAAGAAEADEPTQIRLKGHARRRAARRPVIIRESHPVEHET